MPKSSGQKQKLLFIRQLLLEKSDEEHPLTTAQIQAALTNAGITAEVKSVYDDIETLRQAGMDIEHRRGRGDNAGYYVASREFELAELKLLVDSVQSAKFITHKKSLMLIGKLESLCSSYQGKSLKRQVHVIGRIKHQNENIFYNIDTIHNAIDDNRQISYTYFEYDLKKNRNLRRNGARYITNPLALCWNDENYYLIACDAGDAKIKHYRVDKMMNITISEETREAQALAFNEKTDFASYEKRVFSMFGGEEVYVTMRFANRLVGVVYDRFGMDSILQRDGDEHFKVTVPVDVSPQFFGWLFGFGAEAQVLEPPQVRDQMRRILKDTAALY